MHYVWLLTLSSTVNCTIKNLFCTWLWCHSWAVASDITTQPKQGRQAGPMSSLCILLCLWLQYSWKFCCLSYPINKIWHAWDEYLMFKIGMIDQIKIYFIVVVLWQLSQEQKMCKCRILQKNSLKSKNKDKNILK